MINMVSIMLPIFLFDLRVHHSVPDVSVQDAHQSTYSRF
jgi:hypothetical protein